MKHANTSKSAPTVKCPRCGKKVVFDAQSPFRPFCSERCRTGDLGAWASERYRIPEQTPPDGMTEPDEKH